MTRSIPPVQVVQDLYAAYSRGDQTSMIALFDENVDLQIVGQPELVPFAGHRRGREESATFLQDFFVQCELAEFGPDEVLTFDNSVLTLGRIRVHVRATGRAYESSWAHLFTIRDGKIVRLRAFSDTAAAAEAFREV